MIHSDDTEFFCRSRKKTKKSKTRKNERKKERTKVGVSTNEVPGKMQRSQKSRSGRRCRRKPPNFVEVCVDTSVAALVRARERYGPPVAAESCLLLLLLLLPPPLPTSSSFAQRQQQQHRQQQPANCYASLTTHPSPPLT
jgi:hypothetical protein